MKRGSARPYEIEVNQDLTDAVAMLLTFKQLNRTVLVKTMEDIDIAPDTLTVWLTQQETLKFHAGTAEMDLKVRFPGGEVIPSEIEKFEVKRVLNEEIL